MSRVAKWKLEKTKVKVVFRLQFHATHIPQAGWDKLFISFIPADSGKATAKTTKGNVRNGACKWGDPIYETTRLLQDSKSKQYDEKIYKFVVSMGSSRSSVLGEASINLADYADATKPSTVALPLHGSDYGTILHVTVQLLTSKTGYREFEQQRELRERGLQTGTDLIRHDEIGTGKVSSSDTDKVNARVRFRPESSDLPSLEEEVGLTGDYADSAAGFDGSSNTSESLYAEKLDTSSTHEIDSLKSMASGDLNGLSLCQSPQEEKGETSDNRNLAQGSSDWVHGWSSDYSMDNDLAIAHEENSRLRGCLELAESSILELKSQVSSLQSHADEIGMETQKFAQKLAAEISSGEELEKEVSVMKSECSKLKGDLEQLRSVKLNPPQYASRETSNSNHDRLFQGTQVRLLKGLLVVEDKIRELQNKLYLSFQDRDLRFLHSDLEALLIVVQGLKQGTEETMSLLNSPSEIADIKEISEMSSQEGNKFVSVNGLDVDLYQPPDMLHCLSIPSIVSQEPNSTGATNAMKSKIFELLRELDESKAERESLARKMDQMECYYEALVQELEENQKQMLGELQNLRNEHSTCLYTIATTSSAFESMRQDMNEQILRFTEERRDLDSMNRELERRAVTAEAALRRARLNYSIAVDQLRKDLDLLSFQVLSMFETNENLIKQTFSETSQLCFLEHPGAGRSPEESDASDLLQCKNQNAGVKKQALGGDILLGDMKKSLLLQEGLYQKVEEELSEMHLVNVNLDVFSKILQETLLEASADIIVMRKKLDEVAQKLDLSTESKKLLMLQLQTALDDVQTLNEYKASCTAKCSDMALQNQILEAKLESLSNENSLLSQKITEWEVLMRESRVYESKYMACSTEKAELANLLKQETLSNGNLQKEICSLKEELQKNSDFREDKLGSLLASYHKQYHGLFSLFPSTKPLCHDRGLGDSMGVISQLEEIQHNACEKILQLLEEKKNLEVERDLAQLSSSTANSEIMAVKQKFKHDIQNMVTKLEALNALVEKRQLELETLANKFHISSEAEEKYVHQNEELLADLALLESELQQLTSKNKNLCEDIMGLDSVTKELGRSKLTIAELTRETQDLMRSLRDKTEESVKLASEFDSVKESMRFLQDELHVERSFRGNLEGTIADLTSQLNEKHDHFHRFSQQEVELVHFRQLASDLQEEKSRLRLILRQHEECLEKLREESSHLTEVESLLSGMDELIVAADVKVIFIRTQCETQTEEHALKLQSSEMHLKELRKKLFDVEAMLNCSLSAEAHYIEENANLVNAVESLRSELKDSVAQHGVLSDLSSIMAVQLEEYKKKVATLEVRLSEDKSEHSLEVEELKNMLVLSEKEIDTLGSELKDSVAQHGVLSDLNSMMSVQLQEYKKKVATLEVRFSEDESEHSLEVEQLKHMLVLSENEIDTLRSELKDSFAQHGVLSDFNSIISVQQDEYKKKVATLEAQFSEDRFEHSLEVKRLKHMLALSEEEVDILMSSKEELEISVIVLKAKLDELHAQINSLDECTDELMTLQIQCNELTHRLSEQILKTEEFKNLSIHLKELKDEAEAECLRAREKREPEGPSVAMQESLRIAFLREQCENRLQELRQQLSVSKKHGEEMLWKLQDSVDELEHRKKSEASHLKRNEELSLKILELETELQSIISDKREKTKTCDRIKAELECALLSLECCKEEKQRLEDSLEECNEENNRIAAELTLIKGKLESSASTMNILKEEERYGSDEVGHISGDTVLGKAYKETVDAGTSGLECRTLDTAGNGLTGKPLLNRSDKHRLANCEELDDAGSTPIVEGEHSTVPATMQPQDALLPRSVDGISMHAFLEQGVLLQNDSKHLAVINDHFKMQSLLSSMDHLHKELERMKSENSLLPLDDLHFIPNSQGIQTELVQLQKANEELRGIFPLFNEFPGSGNALERVLALEFELAEALRAKKKSSILFQSSFLKQHGDEQAILQSFRDINELIKEMLELKGSYAAVESELKDMHDRYSQLSLQFAEVEGERQKLLMTLKNVRTSQRFTHLSRSSSATLGDHPA